MPNEQWKLIYGKSIWYPVHYRRLRYVGADTECSPTNQDTAGRPSLPNRRGFGHNGGCIFRGYFMKLSIAMCTYNGTAYLAQQLASIAEQTRPPDELVVCDDGSCDGTLEILKAFAAEVSFPVRLCINEQNLGSNKNFERAIKLCDGDVIALCDQDDIWHPEKLMRMEAVLAAEPETALVFTNGEVIDEDSRSANLTLWEGCGFGSHSQERVRAGQGFAVLIERPSVTGATMAFRARFSELLLPIPDTGFVHDEWMALLIAACAKLAMVDEPLIKYRQHAGQQIGVNQPLAKPAQSKVSLLREAMGRENPFSTEIRRLRAVQRRLESKRDLFPCEDAHRLVRNKAAHLEARAGMMERGLSSVPSVLRELMSLRYHRYSRGLYSAMKDLRGLGSNRAQSN
jgi:Glycosyl transferase family 2